MDFAAILCVQKEPKNKFKRVSPKKFLREKKYNKPLSSYCQTAQKCDCEILKYGICQLL